MTHEIRNGRRGATGLAGVAGRAALALPAILALVGCGQHPGAEPGDHVDAGVNANADAGVTYLDAGEVLPRDAGPPVPGPPLWAMLGGNAQRTGRSALLGPRRGAHRAVQLAAAGRVTVEAIGPAGHVYVWIGPEDDTSGDGGRVAALTPGGAMLWSQPVAPGGAPPELAWPGAALTPEGTLLVKGLFPGPASTPDATQTGLVVGLGLDGAPEWAHWGLAPEASLGPEGHGAVIYDAEGRFYAVLGPYPEGEGEAGRRLYAFASDGALRWVWEREVGRAALPLALASDDSPRVIRSTGEEPPGPDEGLYALEPDTGEERWFAPRESLSLDHVTVGYGDQTFVTGDNVTNPNAGPEVYGVDAGGEGVFECGWSPNAADLITTPMALWQGGSWCLGLSVRRWEGEPVDAGALACWDKGSFETARFGTRGDPCGALAVDSENIVYAVTVGNGGPAQIHGVSLPYENRNGEALFGIDLPGETGDCPGPGPASFVHAPALGEGRLYVGSTTGELHIVE